MKLCVDVGNTTIRFGFYQDDVLKEKITLSTDINKLEDEYYSNIKFLCEQKGIDPSKVTYSIYSSVVPNVNEALVGAIDKLFINARRGELTANTFTDLKMNVDNPKEVGNDLIADLVGAKAKYASPLIIIDLGTATKMLLLDKDGVFQSALIMPGIKISADSLFSKAALLPEVDLNNPTNLLDSKNTNKCIKHGIIYGHLEMILGLVNRYEKELGYHLNKIVTGGAAYLLKDILPTDYITDDSLVLDGELIILNNYIK